LPVDAPHEWVRFNSPKSSTDYERIFGAKPDAKLRAKHVFKLEDIDIAAGDVQKLASDIEKFRGTMKVLPFVTPKPIKL